MIPKRHAAKPSAPATTGRKPFDQASLEKEFPSLDSSLITAILLDYPDLSSNHSRQNEVRKTLRALTKEACIDSKPATFGETKNKGTGGGDGWELWDEDKHLSSAKSGHESFEEDPLGFLASCFPRLSLETLQDRHSQSKDLESAVDELLSFDTLESENGSTSTSSSRAPSPTPSSSSSSHTTLAHKQLRRKQKALAKSSNVVSLTSTAHLPRPSPLPGGSTPNFAWDESNTWVSIDSTSTYLSTLLKVSPQQIASTYHHQHSILYRTLQQLLTRLYFERDKEVTELRLAELVSTLSMILPGLDQIRYKLLVKATKGDVSNALDLQNFLLRVERESGGVLGDLLLDSYEHITSTSAPSSVPRSVTSLPSSSSSRTPSALSSSIATSRTSSQECADLAASYLQKRNEAFRTAARHYQKGSIGERGTAFYWAEIGREMDRETKRWEERGARELVEERRRISSHSIYTIDLHSIKLAHAISIASSTLASTPPPIRIITGKGLHSRNNVAIIAPGIVRLLEREGWNFKYDGGDRNGGSITVLGRGR